LKHTYPATLQQEEDGRFSVWFEDLARCATYGGTLEKAISMARDAMCGWLDVAEEQGLPIPSPRAMSEVKLSENQFVAPITGDLEVYRKENDKRAISRTVTLPAWLDSQAKRAGINFSQALQSALAARLGIE